MNLLTFLMGRWLTSCKQIVYPKEGTVQTLFEKSVSVPVQIVGEGEICQPVKNGIGAG